MRDFIFELLKLQNRWGLLEKLESSKGLKYLDFIDVLSSGFDDAKDKDKARNECMEFVSELLIYMDGYLEGLKDKPPEVNTLGEIAELKGKTAELMSSRIFKRKIEGLCNLRGEIFSSVESQKTESMSVLAEQVTKEMLVFYNVIKKRSWFVSYVNQYEFYRKLMNLEHYIDDVILDMKRLYLASYRSGLYPEASSDLINNSKLMHKSYEDRLLISYFKAFEELFSRHAGKFETKKIKPIDDNFRLHASEKMEADGTIFSVAKAISNTFTLLDGLFMDHKYHNIKVTIDGLD